MNSCGWGRIHGPRHLVPKLSGSTEAPSSSPPSELGPSSHKQVPNRRIPRHPLRAHSKAVLQGLSNHRYSRLHIWQRGCSLPKLPNRSPKAHGQAVQCSYSPRQGGP
uniref:Uncharacterized protein n=1 Tax=Opuntia streptacantha TaxID=393608 RepID=A0A7C9ALN0_OPUST